MYVSVHKFIHKEKQMFIACRRGPKEEYIKTYINAILGRSYKIHTDIHSYIYDTIELCPLTQ